MEEALKRELDHLIEEYDLGCPFAVVEVPTADGQVPELFAKGRTTRLGKATARDLYYDQHHCLRAWGRFMNEYANFHSNEKYIDVAAQLLGVQAEVAQIKAGLLPEMEKYLKAIESIFRTSRQEILDEGIELELCQYLAVNRLEETDLLNKLLPARKHSKGAVQQDTPALEDEDDGWTTCQQDDFAPLAVKALQLIVRRPVQSFNGLRDYCYKTRVRLPFLENLHPADDEMLSGLTAIAPKC